MAVPCPAAAQDQAGQLGRPAGAISQTESGETRHPLVTPFVDFGHAVVDFGRDGWAVLSSPARLDRRSALELGAFLTVGGVFFLLDEGIAERLGDGGTEGLHGSLRDAGDFFEPLALQSNTNAILAGTAALAYLTKLHWLQAPAKQLLYSQWIGGLVRQGTGRIIGRLRPNQTSDAYAFEPGTGTSFPSGHSAVAMEIATVLSHHIGSRPVSVALYGAAATVVFQRVDSRGHWASDAWFGAGLGYLVAKTVIRTEESRRTSIQPGVGPDGSAWINLSLRF